ncbi:RHS repeat-associated core domain-containing protein [Lentisphaerota bacterium WC36G]|nr:RHS repeat-associated core domain-containing protein [Lentisphaerae bacterium WC36]
MKILNTTQKLEFKYDYKGRRREKKVFEKINDEWVLKSHKSFIYNKYKLIKTVNELNNGSISDRFVWLGDNLLALEKDGVAFNYIADGNKNITQLINLTTGEIANKYDYSPFGQLAKTDENVENVFKFSSEYAETETGLIYYNYRYYNPTTGKWLSRDPIGEVGGFNLYAISENNLIDYVDMLGLQKKGRGKTGSKRGKAGTPSKFRKGKKGGNTYNKNYKVKPKAKVRPPKKNMPGTKGGLTPLDAIDAVFGIINGIIDMEDKIRKTSSIDINEPATLTVSCGCEKDKKMWGKNFPVSIKLMHYVSYNFWGSKLIDLKAEWYGIYSVSSSGESTLTATVIWNVYTAASVKVSTSVTLTGIDGDNCFIMAVGKADMKFTWSKTSKGFTYAQGR